MSEELGEIEDLVLAAPPRGLSWAELLFHVQNWSWRLLEGRTEHIYFEGFLVSEEEEGQVWTLTPGS